MEEMQSSNLKRKLKNRHIQFIALGGAIGTALFVGSGSAIFAAGPAVILGYSIAGFMTFLMMRQLGEMDTEEPMAGSFSYFAYKYWGKFPGFLAGWNYWILYVLIGIAELNAVSGCAQYWFPNIPTWESALFFFTLISTINVATVKAYGEMEFVFSLAKIITICAMIVVGGYILFINPDLVTGATIKNLWQPATVGNHAGNLAFSGFFPHGLIGFIIALPMIICAFGGIELIGIAAAETEDPKATIPKAVNQAVFRILIFFIGSLVVLLSLCHWSNLKITDSPFVMIFDNIGFKYTAWTLNFVILTASLSVYNSCMYSNSRMLYGLALQKNAPQVFTKTNKRSVPITSLLFSSLLTFLVVPLNYFIPDWFDAFKIIWGFVAVFAIVNWWMITISHLKFKKQKGLENYKTSFPSPFYPYSNYVTLIFYFFIFVTMTLPQLGMVKQVIAVPVWLLLVYVGYKIIRKKIYVAT